MEKHAVAQENQLIKIYECNIISVARIADITSYQYLLSYFIVTH